MKNAWEQTEKYKKITRDRKKIPCNILIKF